MTFRLEERKETKEFLWREWFDTHRWSFEAHFKLHVELVLSQVETTDPLSLSVLPSAVVLVAVTNPPLSGRLS